MNQKELSFFYRGVVLLLFTGIAVTFLSSIDQRWAYYLRNIAVAFLLFAGAAFIIFVSVRQFTQFVNAPVRDEALPANLYSAHSYRTARLAVTGSVLLWAILIATLLFVEPPKQCPNWHLADKQSTSLWLPVFMLTAPILAGLVFMVIRWKWVVQKAVESVDYSTTTPVPYILVMTVLVGCGMSQLPWGLLVAECWWGRYW